MKTLLLVLLLVGTTAIAQQTGPEPAPWWQRVEETQNLVFKWLTFITVVGGAVITAGVGLWMKYKTEMSGAQERMNRATEEKRILQAQVQELAKQMPPPAAPVVPIIVTDNNPPPAATPDIVKP